MISSYKYIILFSLIISTISPAFSEESDGHEKKERSTFELSNKVISTLNINSEEIKYIKKNKFKVPPKSLVAYGEEHGVFKRAGNDFELIEVVVHRKSKDFTEIKSSHLKSGDQIVTSGVALLRVAHLEASGHGGDSCAD